MDVAPGVERPLWPSEVTRRALAEGGWVETIAERACANPQCGIALLCVRRAGYVLCPDCSTVSPLRPSPSSSEAEEASGPPSSASAICVGVKRDEPSGAF
jgi:uncharacterized Zn finger protein (UPF0148 family)